MMHLPHTLSGPTPCAYSAILSKVSDYNVVSLIVKQNMPTFRPLHRATDELQEGNVGKTAQRNKAFLLEALYHHRVHLLHINITQLCYSTSILEYRFHTLQCTIMPAAISRILNNMCGHVIPWSGCWTLHEPRIHPHQVVPRASPPYSFQSRGHYGKKVAKTNDSV